MSEDMPHEWPAAARQEACRSHVQSAETWLRKLVHSELSLRDGANYITHGPWKRPLIEYVVAKTQADPNKYRREVDATTFEQLIDIALHPNNAWPLLSTCLKIAYPNGASEARTFLERIAAIRNDVSHGRQCSVRQLEQAICYGNDLSDAIKEHFRRTNLAKEFNVPTFVAFSDSLGNGEPLVAGEYFRTVDLSGASKKRLYPGDVLTVEVEVDPSFEANGYQVVWWLKTAPQGGGDGRRAQVAITNKHVGERMELQFKIKTNNDWHRNSSGYDDVIDFYFRVLPPP